MVCYLLGYLLLDTVSHTFDVGSGISVWYLPAALALALLFVFGLRYLHSFLLRWWLCNSFTTPRIRSCRRSFTRSPSRSPMALPRCCCAA